MTSLCLELYQTHSPLQAFALALLSSRPRTPPGATHPLPSLVWLAFTFQAQPKCHLLKGAFPGYFEVKELPNSSRHFLTK